MREEGGDKWAELREGVREEGVRESDGGEGVVVGGVCVANQTHPHDERSSSDVTRHCHQLT